ncbi:hypothetical protein P3875_10305 [Myroides sp. JBRI-B21084]|uniref:hypothetical protein n=1 Tax=Myroides sp. JBRI-B21084 TaxID=3119977 RepID=UPI0026E396AF|nr:hypothetical protein [Paenimyroides cloacae]WKW46164.1 hypothetical protein P3875_10305 [Paenimyroides cloacae]
MKQIEFNENQLILKVKKSPLLARLLLYFITFLSIALPLGGFIVNMISNVGLSFFHILFLFIFGFIAFYMLRVSLWNTFGKESIEFVKNKLTYVADYHWFKDKVKEFTFENINFDIKQVGYEEDNKGVLVIKFDDGKVLETVTKIPIADLEIFINNINNSYL